MKRLLCIVGSMNAGGAETFLMKIYRQLDKTKYQMDFAVAVAEEGFYDKEIIKLGGKTYRITPKSDDLLKNFIEIKKFVKNEHYNYVLRTSQHSLSALELLAAKWGGAKVRVFRSSNSNTTTGSKKQMLLHKICMFMPRHFANVRIAPSTEAAEFMFGKGCVAKERAFLLHNAVDTSIYEFISELREKHRTKFNITDKFVVGHVGRFNQQKNHIFLLQVFQNVLQLIPNSVLLLVGIGELMNDVKQMADDLNISDHIIFTGVRSDVPELLSAMDVFVFPSLYEGMPNTVIEAQATGLPCVIADTITREADITGLVNYLPLGDAELWANKVVETHNQKRKNTKNCFACYKYDIKSTTDEFVQIIFRGNKSENKV